MTRQFDCRQIINHRKYPIDEPGHPARSAAIEQVRASLADDGCAVIRDFFSTEGLQALLGEAEARKSQAYYSPRKLCNVYLNDGDPSTDDLLFGRSFLFYAICRIELVGTEHIHQTGGMLGAANHLSRLDSGQSLVEALKFNREPFVIEPQQL